MKHLVICNKILSKQNIRLEDLSSFLVDYCISKNKPDAIKYIQQIIQLINHGEFNITHIIKEYAKDNNKQFYSLSLNKVMLKQWVE